VCYLLRLIQTLGVFVEGEWTDQAYSVNSLVSYDGQVYISKSSVPAGVGNPAAATTYWLLAVEGGTGPQGPPGPTGPAGGSFLTWTHRTLTGTGNIASSDQFIFAEPAIAAITLTLPVISTLDDGKFFVIRTDGAFNVQIDAGAGNTIASGASYTLTTAGETLKILSRSGDTNWYIY
jgi:hypothetical protein